MANNGTKAAPKSGVRGRFARSSDQKGVNRRGDRGLCPEEAADRSPPADELMAILAHELRTPLGGILVALQSMHHRRSDERAARQARDSAERKAWKMSRIIDNLLDLSRGVHGKLVLHARRVDLAEVVSGAVETANPILTARGHRLTVSLSPEPVSLVADACRLEQVLVNLLTNAARYTEPGGQIRLATAAAAGLVFVRVKDNGMGIAPDLLPHVFDLFRQGAMNGARVPCGMGIGLSVVKSLVELHGGTVSAYSHGPGTGSEFIVRLPADGFKNGANQPRPPRTRTPAAAPLAGDGTVC